MGVLLKYQRVYVKILSSRVDTSAYYCSMSWRPSKGNLTRHYTHALLSRMNCSIAPKPISLHSSICETPTLGGEITSVNKKLRLQ